METRTRCKNNSGFTLLELMFAGGIMAMSMSLLFGSLIGLSVTGGLTESQAIAVTHLSSVAEELNTMSFTQLAAYAPPTFGNLGSAETIEVRCQDASGAMLTLPVDAATASNLPNPLTVQVVVTWQDQRGYTFTKTATQQIYR